MSNPDLVADLANLINFPSRTPAQTNENRYYDLLTRFRTEAMREVFTVVSTGGPEAVTSVEAMAMSLHVGEATILALGGRHPAAEQYQDLLSQTREELVAVREELARLQSAYNVLRNDASGFRSNMRNIHEWMQEQNQLVQAAASGWDAFARHWNDGVKLAKQSVRVVTDLNSRLEAEAPRQAPNEPHASAPHHRPSPRRD